MDMEEGPPNVRSLMLVLWCLSAPGVLLAASVAGSVENPKACTGVQALLREGEGVNVPAVPKVFDGALDRATGAFVVDGLPEGRYDLRLLVPDGWVDGVDMRLEEPLPDEDAAPFGVADEAQIRDAVASYPDSYPDIFRVLAVRGNPQTAKALVEKIRARPFHGGAPGDLIWRVEVWRFENQTGAWVKARGGTETVARIHSFAKTSKGSKANRPLRRPAAEFEPMVWLFSAELGGIEVGAEEKVTGLAVAVPDIDKAHGKIPGSVREQADAWLEKNKEPYLE
jgi:hypothetical protein